MISWSARRYRLPLLAGTASIALAASMLTVTSAAAAPAKLKHLPVGPRHSLIGTHLHGSALPRVLEQGSVALPAGVPRHGSYGFLLRLRSTPTLATYERYAPLGRAAAASAARSQYARIRAQQADVIAALPRDSRVLYKAHSVLAGVAVLSDVADYAALRAIRDVQAVYPIAPKSQSNSYAVPLVGTPAAWESHGGDRGQNSTIAVIDTGVDYTHANFGGPGTTSAYDTALASDAAPVDPGSYDHAKFDTALRTGDNQPAGFYDFAGDAYDAGDPAHDTPDPDPNSLDCSGHGSHVAGTAAGFGVDSGGSTYSGPYDTSTDFGSMQIGPGMAPEATLLAFKVFGCGDQATTNVVGAGIEAAADPNGDGNPADHADVINMSLGADYGSPQDGDSVLSNLASKAGITVVVASGNGGDYYDVGGSPGDAVRTIAVANSVDAFSRIDTLHASVNSVAKDYGAQRSVAYDWTGPDISGTVDKVTDPANADGCDPIADSFGGDVVFLTWTDNDAARRCGSATRAANALAANAGGVILGEDSETFAAGILGSADLPVVQVVKSAADEIKAALDAAQPQPVTVSGTTANSTDQLIPGNNDLVNSSSSRGIRGEGNLKPDVTAVGTSVFSTAMGTGTEGVSETGTSMATPMVAGLAALVRTAHPAWTPEQVKADIMNTAGQNLRTGVNHTGGVYAPNRVGAGRIKADDALSNGVLAYVHDDPGAVSVSFGPVAITGPTTLTKTVDVVNKTGSPAGFTVEYRGITKVPGVSYQVSPSSLSLAASGAGATKKLTVKLVVTNPAKLTKTRDATVARRVSVNGNRIPREFLADASGRVEFEPTGGYTGPSLRLPVYSAPRPASAMTERSRLALGGSGAQFATMRLLGHGVRQGTGTAKIQSYMAGFELQARSGLAPTCAAPTDAGCVHFRDERAADLKYVGFTSDSPLISDSGFDPIGDGQAYFAITTQRPWRTPVGPQEFDILIDTNADGNPDAVLYNTRFGAEDIFFSELLDLSDPANPCIRDDELINDRLGSTDTALFDSDTMMLPFWPKTLGKVSHAPCFDGGSRNLPALPSWSRSHTRIHYGVLSFGESGLVDVAGVSPAGRPRLTVDVIHPGVEMVALPQVVNAPTVGLILNPDMPGVRVTVRRDVAAYKADHAQGALVVHFHNRVGAKAKIVTLKSKPKVGVKLSATRVAAHHRISATVSVANTAGYPATGRVVLHNGNGVVLRHGQLRRGRITFTWRAGAAGRASVYAVYAGDRHYVAGRSARAHYRVT